MDLSKLKFNIGIMKTELSNDASLNPPKDDTASIIPSSEELAQAASDAILCQSCGIEPRKNASALLCDNCNKRQLDDAIAARKPQVEIEVPRELHITGIKQIRTLEFAPVSVRYAGKELDAIAWAMLPAIPSDVKEEIQRIIANVSRKIGNTNPSIQDLDVTAEIFQGIATVIRSLSEREKVKLKIKARPILEEKNAALKEKVKTDKIQKSIPADPTSRHTANVLLINVCEINAPVDVKLQSLLKKFLDFVSLQAQIEDEPPSKQWVLGLLSKPQYVALKPYFKFKA